MISASTNSFCLTVSSIDGVTSGAGDFHARHCWHVSMIFGTTPTISGGTPAALRTFSIWLLPACHHLKWSFWISFTTWAAVPVLSMRRLRVTSNDVQSSEASPDARSSTRGWSALVLGSKSGPLPGRLPAIGVAGAGPVDDAAPVSGGVSACSASGRCVMWFSNLPGTPALADSLSGMRASLGCFPLLAMFGQNGPPGFRSRRLFVAHRHSPAT